MDKFIVLGNGKSLADVDFDILDNHDTIGLNNAHKQYEEIDWFPKYYGIFDLEGSLIDYKALFSFLERHHKKIKTIFYYSSELDEYIINSSISFDNLQYVNLTSSELINLDMNFDKFAPPLQMEIQQAKELLDPKYQDSFQLFIDFLSPREHNEIYKLNKRGIYKYFWQEYCPPSDKITKPRFNLEWTLPDSFEQFNFMGGNSGMIAALIGYLMGYKMVILLGVDTLWKSKDGIYITKGVFWFENYFHKDYNINEICDICTADAMGRMHINKWQKTKESFDAHGTDIEIVNCTPNSALEMFRMSTLEDELWK